MVYIHCDGGDQIDECGSSEFHLNFMPPLRCEAVCVECGASQEIGGDNRADGRD